MSYTPHEWVSGETVTASKLNHIEDGIANGAGGLIVDIETENSSGGDTGGIRSGETKTSNTIYNITSHTWQEIYDAVENGSVVIGKLYTEYSPSSTKTVSNVSYYYYINYLDYIGFDDNYGNYIVVFSSSYNSISFYALDPDDYPTTGALETLAAKASQK